MSTEVVSLAVVKELIMKEKVIRAARKSEPDRVQFFEDFAKATLERRRQIVPELIKARKQGKKAFLVMDRVVYAKLRPPDEGEQ